MTFKRLRYPGVGPKSRVYSGALAPSVRRLETDAGVATRTDQGGPLFGRRIFHRGASRYELRWPTLTHAEAQSIRDEWDEAYGGAVPRYYTPDDMTEPIVVVAVTPPVLSYLSAAVATVTIIVEEQR